MSLFGFLCCNKPAHITSRDVVNVVQRRLRHEMQRRDVKVGHAGTLDPLAVGVLVVGVGPASRLVPYVQQQPKRYRAKFRFGQSTVSGDLEGEITRHPDLPVPSRQQIDAAVIKLTGSIEQTPPAHSAIWVDGQRAYKRIRAGETFAMPVRTVEVHSLDVLEYEFPEIELDIRCGSGTYIRSIGIDLATAVGSAAVMTELTRQTIGQFNIEQSVSIDQLGKDPIESMLLPATMGVDHLPKIIIDDLESVRLGHGLGIREGSHAPSAPADTAAIDASGKLVAIVRWNQHKHAWYPYRVFPV